MRPRIWLVLTLLLVLSVASPVLARVATIETTAPLRDHGEQSITTALKDALEIAVKGALAMGLSWVRVSNAVVLENVVAVQIIATDTEPGQAQEEEGAPPGNRPGPRPERPSRMESL